MSNHIAGSKHNHFRSQQLSNPGRYGRCDWVRKSVVPTRLQIASEMRLWQKQLGPGDSGTWERDACLLLAAFGTLRGNPYLYYSPNLRAGILAVRSSYHWRTFMLVGKVTFLSRIGTPSDDGTARSRFALPRLALSKDILFFFANPPDSEGIETTIWQSV